MATQFHYLITIHNKESLIEQTLQGVEASARPGSIVYPILDGCSDRSEELVDMFTKATNLTVKKLLTPDVHELRSINAGLRAIGDRSGYVVVLQDDVFLEAPTLEEDIHTLYSATPFKLGVVSLRLATNLRQTSWIRQLRNGQLFGHTIDEIDLISRPNDGMVVAEEGSFSTFYPRMVAIKGPNILPTALIREVGLLDERMAPYGYDDHEFCVRAMRAGFINGLYPVKFSSEAQWGSTRRDPKRFAREARPIHLRNRRHVWNEHGQMLGPLALRLNSLPAAVSIQS
jgi:GT2 family glycosyltransferase